MAFCKEEVVIPPRSMFHDPLEVVVGAILPVYDPILAGKKEFCRFHTVKQVVMLLFYLFHDPEKVVDHKK